jgi:hypothetical protein
MRPTFVHVLTGLLLGTALAGLLNVPGQVVARQESIPPVRTPKVAKAKGEVVVRISPKVEAALVAEQERRARARLGPPKAKPPAVAPPVLIRNPFPVHTRVVSPPAPDPAPQAAPPPKPEPVAAKPRPKPPEPVKKVVLVQPPPAVPPPAPPPPPPAADEDDDDDHGDGHRGHRKRYEKHSKSNGRKRYDDGDHGKRRDHGDRHDPGEDYDRGDDHDRHRDRDGHGDRHGGHRH